MKPSLLLRRLHAWTLTIFALPLLVVSLTGIALHLKKSVQWIQPAEQRGTTESPSLSFRRVLEICRGVPELEVAEWTDITRVDLRPEHGVLKVTTKNSWEAQLDAADGRVLSIAVRRSDLVEALHDGSWFHPLVKNWLFLPTGVLLSAGVLTGVYLFMLPALKRRRKTRQSAHPVPGAREDRTSHVRRAGPTVETDLEPT